ncbi:methionine--tRNA ligase [Psychroflexus sp. ALD_RP9]|uniref:methionine--tRNA ligase n=1 Tax=Psychroflexus sp. ALD_RP9 TaxID=2777186 RepID=UPI001A9087E9|nr:methionine--tRNA ligase [Psychroflexus sp. ALD_RP9]QSS98070.1 methionine--tRNA ligase [Psychroflexus sp. ALD_RP9]
MKNPKRYTITAALPYTNGPIHIGHLAGVYIPADIYTRYLKLNQKDVVFVCGSDEHGVPITIKAKKEGITPQQVVDRYNAIIKQSFEDFGIQFDNYSRTSAEVHHETASEFFKTLYENDKFIEETTEQLYDAEAKQFLADRFVTGTCPKCGNEEAYGDQCEKCGSSLNATDLIQPKSAITGNTPSLKETKHWFLPLDQYSNWLKQWILNEHKNDWKPNVYGQCKSWIEDGLRPRAVTRDLDWGIPVPVKNAEGKVLYVWFDAPIGYISSTKEWAKREQKEWEPYWKDQDTKLVHFIGKDNIVFHCIIFPVMLKAHGDYILPDNVPSNEFLNLEGQKLSTSKNWAVWLHEYLDDFPNQQDVLRYTLTANAPETKDNDFTWKDFQTRNNSELVGIFGNFINRVVVLTNKYYQGLIPEKEELTKVDLDTLKTLKESTEDISQSIELYRFREAQAKMMNIARLGNKYLADEEPWKLQKTNPERTRSIMYVAIQIAAGLSIISEPFLPFTSKKLKSMLSLNTLENELSWSLISNLDELIPPKHQINSAELLFTKIEDDTIQRQLDKLKQTKQDNLHDNSVVEPQKEEVSFDDFSKLDIRTATILAAEKMPKAKKLLKLKVDTGLDQRTIVSGIAEHFKPEDIVGKKVSVIVNLKPIKLRGTLSEGMILMATDTKGDLSFVNIENNFGNGMIIS